jgi:hypothetical protein
MHEGKRGTAGVIVALAIPVAALGGLTGLATSGPDSRSAAAQAHACASWAVEYRGARADLATADRLWLEAAKHGGYRPVERAEFRDRVAALDAVRPEHCNPTGRLTR